LQYKNRSMKFAWRHMVGVGGGIMGGVRAGRGPSLLQIGCRPFKSWTPFWKRRTLKVGNQLPLNHLWWSRISWMSWAVGGRGWWGKGWWRRMCHSLGGDQYTLILIGHRGRLQQWFWRVWRGGGGGGDSGKRGGTVGGGRRGGIIRSGEGGEFEESQE